jgi:hypothetical protein
VFRLRGNVPILLNFVGRCQFVIICHLVFSFLAGYRYFFDGGITGGGGAKLSGFGGTYCSRTSRVVEGGAGRGEGMGGILFAIGSCFSVLVIRIKTTPPGELRPTEK